MSCIAGPMYCSENYEGDWNVTIGMRVCPHFCLLESQFTSQPFLALCCPQDAFEALLYQNKVDLFVAGHYHSYERCALFQ